jgi:hypothetical protein
MDHVATMNQVDAAKQCRINAIQGSKPDWWKVTTYINDVIFTQQHRYYLKKASRPKILITRRVKGY